MIAEIFHALKIFRRDPVFVFIVFPVALLGYLAVSAFQAVFGRFYVHKWSA